MFRLLCGTFVLLTVATFVLSWAYAFSGMLWPAQTCNALAVAQAAFYVMWMRPRRKRGA
jgi:hypothetical protein